MNRFPGLCPWLLLLLLISVRPGFALDPEFRSLCERLDARLHHQHIHLYDAFVTVLPAGRAPALPLILARTLPRHSAPEDTRDPWYDTLAVFPREDGTGEPLFRRVGPFRRSALSFRDFDGDSNEEAWLVTLPRGPRRERQCLLVGRLGTRVWLDGLPGKGYDRFDWERDGQGAWSLRHRCLTGTPVPEPVETLYRRGPRGFETLEAVADSGARAAVLENPPRRGLSAAAWNRVAGHPWCVAGQRSYDPQKFSFEYSLENDQEGLRLRVRVKDPCSGHSAEGIELALAPVHRWHEPLRVRVARPGATLKLESNAGVRSLQGRPLAVAEGWGVELRIPAVTLERYRIKADDPLVRFVLRAIHARGGEAPAERWVLSSSGKAGDGVEAMSLAPWRP